MDPVIVKIIELLSQDSRVAVVWLYGSRVSGEATGSSDYDLAVAFNDCFTSDMDNRLKSEVLGFELADALGLPVEKISCVDINFIPLPLAATIVVNGKVILSKDGLREAREENRVTGMWELDYEFHQRQFG